MKNCCEAPFIEQLRSVPIDYRTCVAIQWATDGSETGHRFIPVGYMMHEAAEQIERLRLQRDSWKEVAEHQYGLVRTAHTGDYDYPVDGALDAWAAGRHPILKPE